MTQPFNPNGTAYDPAKRNAGRGFASMDPVRQREIASQGGRAAHASGNAHQFTSEEARAAGRKRHENRAGDKPVAAYSAESGPKRL
jgi:uncharacterized protein